MLQNSCMTRTKVESVGKKSEVCFKNTLLSQAKMLMKNYPYESGRFCAELLNYLKIKGTGKMRNIPISVWETEEREREERGKKSRRRRGRWQEKGKRKRKLKGKGKGKREKGRGRGGKGKQKGKGRRSRRGSRKGKGKRKGERERGKEHLAFKDI